MDSVAKGQWQELTQTKLVGHGWRQEEREKSRPLLIRQFAQNMRCKYISRTSLLFPLDESTVKRA